MRMQLSLLAVACALVVSGCGGGGGGGVGADASATFFAAVAAVVAAPIDTVDADPALVDSTVLGTSDTAEPVPI